MNERVRGFKVLVQVAVDQGSRALERVQIQTAKIPFDLLAQIPGARVPAEGVRKIYNTGVSSTHTMVRLVNQVVGDTLDAVLETASPGGNDEAKPKV